MPGVSLRHIDFLVVFVSSPSPIYYAPSLAGTCEAL